MIYICEICKKDSTDVDFKLKEYNTPVSIPVYFRKTNSKIIYFCGPEHSLKWYEELNEDKKKTKIGRIL